MNINSIECAKGANTLPAYFSPMQSAEKKAGQVGDRFDGTRELPKKGKPGFLERGTQTLLAGIGLGSGASGGAILGASVAAGTTLIEGLLARNLTLAALTAGAMAGGAAGAIIFGVCGAYGGWMLAEGIINAGKFVNRALFTREPLSPEAAEAFTFLNGIEGNAKDAREDMRVITDSLKTDESLSAEAGNFGFLLKSFGAEKSDEARSAYLSLRKYVSPKEREAALQGFQELAGVLGSSDSAMDTLYLIMKNRNTGDSIQGECAQMLSIARRLKDAAADSEVPAASMADVYLSLKSNFPPSERANAMEAILGPLTQKKMAAGDIAQNLKTILDNRCKGDDLAKEAAGLAGLIDDFGGESTDACQAYAVAKREFPQSEREEVIAQFKELKTLTGSPVDAAVFLRKLSTMYNGATMPSLDLPRQPGKPAKMHEGETLKGECDFFKGLYASVGAGAFNAYDTIRESYPPGKDRNLAAGSLLAIAAVLNSASKPASAAAGDLKWLIGHMSKGETLAQETEKYCTYLKQFASSSDPSDLAHDAYLKPKFKETWKS